MSIKNSIDSLTFFPSLIEVLKLPSNPLFSANSSNSLFFSSLSSCSKRSILFSTIIQGNFPPSKNVATPSIEFFIIKVLYKINIVIYMNKTYSFFVCSFVASDIYIHP
jgi:hypothetical protein